MRHHCSLVATSQVCTPLMFAILSSDESIVARRSRNACWSAAVEAIFLELLSFGSFVDREALLQLSFVHCICVGEHLLIQCAPYRTDLAFLQVRVVPSLELFEPHKGSFDELYHVLLLQVVTSFARPKNQQQPNILIAPTPSKMEFLVRYASLIASCVSLFLASLANLLSLLFLHTQ